MKKNNLKRWLIAGILLMLINDAVQIAIAYRQFEVKMNSKARKRIIRGLKKKARRARVKQKVAAKIKEK